VLLDLSQQTALVEAAHHLLLLLLLLLLLVACHLACSPLLLLLLLSPIPLYLLLQIPLHHLLLRQRVGSRSVCPCVCRPFCCAAPLCFLAGSAAGWLACSTEPLAPLGVVLQSLCLPWAAGI
jgi:hypothetical protein